jgi:hypothetical protein
MASSCDVRELLERDSSAKWDCVLMEFTKNRGSNGGLFLEWKIFLIKHPNMPFH